MSSNSEYSNISSQDQRYICKDIQLQRINQNNIIGEPHSQSNHSHHSLNSQEHPQLPKQEEKSYQQELEVKQEQQLSNKSPESQQELYEQQIKQVHISEDQEEIHLSDNCVIEGEESLEELGQFSLRQELNKEQVGIGEDIPIKKLKKRQPQQTRQEFEAEIRSIIKQEFINIKSVRVQEMIKKLQKLIRAVVRQEIDELRRQQSEIMQKQENLLLRLNQKVGKIYQKIQNKEKQN